MFKVNGVELSLNLMDADCAEIFERECKKLQNIKDILTSEDSLAQGIRKACHEVFDAIDSLFGEGTHKKLFGASCDLVKCAKAWKDITENIEEELKDNVNNVI